MLLTGRPYEKRLIQAELQRALENADAWNKKAELAVTKNVDDLARETLAPSRVLLTEAQHAFDMLRPLASQLGTNPTLFAVRDSAMHQELEDQVKSVVRRMTLPQRPRRC